MKYSDSHGYLYDRSNTVSDEIIATLKAHLIPSNSVIFAKIGEAIRLNRRSLNMEPCCIDNNLIAFISNDSCLYKYVYYWTQLQELYDLAKATTVPAIRKSDLEMLVFPLPPLAEQQRIVERIESLFEKLDLAKELIQDALDSFENRKAAILHKAFSGELTKKWREENGIKIDTWSKLTLNDVAKYKKGPFGSSITKAMFVAKGENTYKVYEQGNAIRKKINYGHYYITKEKYEELKGFNVDCGDIIISCAGTIGEIYKLPNEYEKGVINQALMRVRVNSNINEQFFIYYFSGIIKGDINEKANGTAIKNIPPFKVMKAIKINLPTMAEQIEIVNILNNYYAKEQKSQKASETVIKQISHIKKSILSRAFRGQLGTNDPQDDSAIELLRKSLK